MARCARLAVLLSSLASLGGCAILTGSPATSLGADQDRINRRINAQYDPALPGKLPTDYEERGRVIDNGASNREWKEIYDYLFRPHLTQVPFRDEPAPCPDPDTVLSCSATFGCQCRQRATPSARPISLPP